MICNGADETTADGSPPKYASIVPDQAIGPSTYC
jgi:hypothetical protein